MTIEPLKFNTVQWDLWDHLSDRNIILKFRQPGVSSFVQGHEVHQTTTRTTNALTISDTDDNTMKLRAINQRFYDLWPENIPKPERKKDSARMVTYPQLDSESVCVTAGAKTGGRGGTVSFFHGSEVAFWKDADAVFGAALQGLTPSSIVYLESTPNGAQGRFYDLTMESLDGNKDWRLHFYPWWWGDDCWLPLDEGEIITPTDDEEEAILKAHQGGFDLKPEQIKWRRKKKRELPHTFLQEYPEDPTTCFLLSGSSYFGDVSDCFNAALNVEPSSDMTYDAGLDLAQMDDYAAMPIGCRNTRQQVDMLHIRHLPWREIRKRIVEKCKHWNVKRLVVEMNSIGSVNFEELRHALKGSNTELIPFTTSPTTKPILVSSLYSALHEEGLQLQNIVEEDWVQKREFTAFRAKQNVHTYNWTYEASGKEHDDSVIGAGLMWLAMTRPDIAQIGYLD